jgi:hypothetical protein
MAIRRQERPRRFVGTVFEPNKPAAAEQPGSASYPRLRSRVVRVWWIAARATALAVSLTAWTVYHRFKRGLRSVSLSGCGLKNRSGLIERSRYAVATAPVVELAAATISQTLLLE